MPPAIKAEGEYSRGTTSVCRHLATSSDSNKSLRVIGRTRLRLLSQGSAKPLRKVFRIASFTASHQTTALWKRSTNLTWFRHRVVFI